MHEAVLPQTTREMLASGDWIVPTGGGFPWLERPPLPQWVTAAICAPLGACDTVWAMRLPAHLAGVVIVLIVAHLTAVWFGRATALMAGVMLATMFEFVSYAWLAEADIFLAVVVTGAVAVFGIRETGARESSSRLLLAFFVLLGLTNLAKGLLFGAVLVLAPVTAWLLWDRRVTGTWLRARSYLWGPGWLLCAAIAISWPLAAYLRYPDVLALWRFDLLGRLDGSYAAITEPWWYYLAMWPGAVAPWTPLAAAGLFLASRDGRFGRDPRYRLLLVWAVVPLLLLSAASGKHHHYMVQALAPWAMLSALAGRWLWQRLPRALRARPVWIGGTAAIATIYFALHSLYLPVSDQCRDDTALLRAIRAQRAPGQMLVANADLRSMDLFRNLFYLDSDVRTVHTLAELDDERFAVPEVFVLTRARDRAALEAFGDVSLLLQSAHTRRESGPEDRLTLFRLRYRPGLERRRHDRRITPMQAMYR